MGERTEAEALNPGQRAAKAGILLVGAECRIGEGQHR
jgi:hypothetical protein